MDKFELRHNERLIPNDIGYDLLNKYVLIKRKGCQIWIGRIMEKDGTHVLLYDAILLRYWGDEDCVDLCEFCMSSANENKMVLKNNLTSKVNCIWLSDVKIIIGLSEELSDYYESIINKEELKND